VQYRPACHMSVLDLRSLGHGGAPAPGGRPNAEPGGGARQRRREAASLLIKYGSIRQQTSGNVARAPVGQC